MFRAREHVEMRAGHHIAGFGIGTRDVGEDVVRIVIGILVVNAAVDVDLHVAELSQSCEPPIVLGAEFQARKLGRFAGAVAVAFAMHQTTLAPRHLNPGYRAFLGQEIVQLRPESKALDSLLPGFGIEDRLLVLVQLDQVGVAEALERRVAVVLRRPGPGHQHDLSRQFPLPVGKVLVADHGSDDHRRVQHAIGGGRPCNGNAPQLQRPRRGHAHVRGLDPPAAAEIEALGADVFE